MSAVDMVHFHMSAAVSAVKAGKASEVAIATAQRNMRFALGYANRSPEAKRHRGSILRMMNWLRAAENTPGSEAKAQRQQKWCGQ